VNGRRRERLFTIGESGKVAGGEGGKVGARQRGLDEGVGRSVFSGEGLEPVPEVKRQVPYYLQPQRAFGVWPAGVDEEACGQGSCIRGGALSGWHRVGFYPKVGRAGCQRATPYEHIHRQAQTSQARYI
jgi:hypothetical protein